MPEVNFDDVVVELDNLMCDCDHMTFVAKLRLPVDESGERSTIPIARMCVKKKTWFFTEIKHIVVSESYRRKGVARFLMNWILNAEHPDIEDTKLVFTPLVGGTVRLDNNDAQAFLASCEFHPSVAFVNQSTGTNLLLMIRSLSPIQES